MATDTKTIPFFVATSAATVTNNTLTALSQITGYIPESGVVIKSVKAFWSFNDQVSATGGTTTSRRLDVSLGGGIATSYTNTVTLANTGENISPQWDCNLTTQFVSQWTGTSMTIDVSVLVNMTTGTTQTTTDHTVVIMVTYEYDDTSATQIKVAWEALNASTGAVSSAFVTRDTIPAWDTYLPEASKVYRQSVIWVQGNELTNAGTTNDLLMVMVDSITVLYSNTLVNSLATDRFTVMIADAISLTKNATHTFSLVSTQSKRNHAQAWAVVVYEFDATAANRVRNSMILPVAGDGGLIGAASNATTSFPVTFEVQEPGTLSDVRIAFFMFWSAISSAGTISARVGSGSFVSHTDTGAVFSGPNALMIRNDAAYTLQRGDNTFVAEAYCTSPGNTGGACGFWMISYTSDKAAGGHGVHTKTRWANIVDHKSNSGLSAIYNAISHQPAISQSDWRMVHAGIFGKAMSGTGTPSLGISVARSVGHSRAFEPPNCSDAEMGSTFCYGDISYFYKRWSGDPQSNRETVTNSRFWRVTAGASGAASMTFMPSLTHLMTYHAIRYTVAGTVYGCGAADSVTIQVHRYDTDECVGYAYRTGPGAFSTTTFTNAVDTYVVAYTSATRVGRSKRGVAGVDTFDVILGPRLGHVSGGRVGRAA